MLYITSFNYTLYKLTGRKFLKSFVKNVDENIVIATEDTQVVENIDYNKNLCISHIGLSEDYYHWIDKYGNMFSDIVGMKSRTIGWFTKFYSIYRVYKNYSFDYLLWIDCDCEVLKKVDKDDIIKIFGKSDIIYHYGLTRMQLNKGIESGIIGFKNSHISKRILDECYYNYYSGKFLDMKRWDDAWLFTKAIEKFPDGCKDLIKGYSSSGHVVQNGPFAHMVRHNKGTHKELI